MIRIITRKIDSEKSVEEIITAIEKKTLRTEKGLDSTSTINMTENDKDFYGYKKNDRLYLSRIRRLSFLGLLPKLIIVIPHNEKKYEIKLGLFTMFIGTLLIIALASNTYELIDTHRFTKDFKSVLILGSLFIGLIWIEINMYRLKLKKYFG